MEEEKAMMAEEKSEPYKVYETKEAWQESIDAIIGSRLRDYRETKESMEALTPLLEELKTLSGAEEVTDIPEKLKERMEKSAPPSMEELQAVFPEADLEGMEENEYFNLALRAGLSPAEAVKLALRSEPAEEAPRNKKPVEESAPYGAKGMVMRITPSKMSFKELDEISARVARGEKISF